MRLAEEVQSRTAELEDITFELHLAQSIASMGSFSFDNPSGKYSCSPEAARLFDLQTCDGFEIDEWLSKVHPDDREFVNDAWARALVGAPYDKTYRIVVPGGIRSIGAGARFRRDSEGKALSAVGSLLDVMNAVAAIH